MQEVERRANNLQKNFVTAREGSVKLLVIVWANCGPGVLPEAAPKQGSPQLPSRGRLNSKEIFVFLTGGGSTGREFIKFLTGGGFTVRDFIDFLMGTISNAATS